MKKLLLGLMLIIMNARGETALDADPAPDPDVAPDPTPDAWKELYPDSHDKIEWPADLADSIKESPSLKAFVDEEGKFRTASLLKSFVETKKMVGQQGAKLPSENSSDEELNEFWAKLGYEAKPEVYSESLKLGEDESKLLGDDSIKAIVDSLHANRVPAAQAKEILGSLVGLKKSQDEALVAGLETKTQETIAKLNEEWGEKAAQNFTAAKMVMNDIGGEEISAAITADPMLGSNPTIIKLLAKVGEKLYGEGDFKGTNTQFGKKTPEEASEEINAIMGDSKDAYHLRDHSSHNDRVKYVQGLFAAKNA